MSWRDVNPLTEIRLSLGLRQTDFAKLVGISKSAVGFYETGRQVPSARVIVKIATATGHNPNTLLNSFGHSDKLTLLKRMRLSRGLKQDEFAAVLGIKSRSYAPYECGSARPGRRLCEKIAEVTGYNLLKLLVDCGHDVSQFYCIWHKVVTVPEVWVTRCGKKHFIIKREDWKYCPYCSKEIGEL